MLVSIIIPCYNSEEFISDCLNSCLNQTHQDIEIICVNDGSVDSTEEIILEFLSKHQGKITLESQSNAGACSARNKGIKMAKGKYFQFLDADDALKPDKITSDISLLQKHSHPDLLIGTYTKTEIDGKELLVEPAESNGNWLNLFQGKMGITSANLFKRELFTELQVSWNEKLKSSQEYDVLFQCLKLNSIKLVYSLANNTYVIRRNLQSISSKNRLPNFIRRLDLRINMLEFLQSTKNAEYLSNKNEFEQTLFEAIKALGQDDLNLANTYFIKYLGSSFKPESYKGHNKFYLLLFRVFGFKTTEKLKSLIN